MSKSASRGGGSEPEKEPFLLSVLPFAGLGLLVLIGVLWRYVPETNPVPTTEEEVAALVIRRWEQQPVREIPITPGRDFTHGPADAAITIVEFSDFECPYCRSATSATQQVLDRYAGRVRLVFKNLPLDVACNETMRQPLHPFACETAVMARCAGQQSDELFWETHDALFAEQTLSRSVVDAVPTQLDLSLERLRACMDSEEPLRAVQEDIEVATGLGVSSTPTFFLNGRRVSDYRFGALDALVEHVLEMDEAGAESSR